MKSSHQKGYITLFVVLILLASAPFYIFSLPSKESLLLQRVEYERFHLQQAKNQLLLFSQFTPELYAANDTLGAKRAPGPGYLPCPDTDGNGLSNYPCPSDNDFVIGHLPQRLAGRSFNFINSDRVRIWYAVDRHYLNQNNSFHNSTVNRLTPLNSQHPGYGRLNFNGRDNLIAVLIIDDGTLSNPENFLQSGSPSGNSPRLSLTLSHAEWRQTLKQRLHAEKHTLCQMPADQTHWFNECNSTQSYHPPCLHDSHRNHNPAGNNWRQMLC